MYHIAYTRVYNYRQMAREVTRAPAPVERNKHQLRTEETKAKLLEASLRVFTRDGFEAARIEDIAAEAGFTRGAFYAHFPSKGDLFLALLERESERVRDKCSRIVTEIASKDERIAAFRAFYVNRASDKQWSILMLEFKLFVLRHPHLQQQMTQAHRMLRATFGQWLVEAFGESLPGHASQYEAIRAALESALTGLVLERVYDPKRLSDAQLRMLLGQIFDAVAKPEDGRSAPSL